MRHEAVHPAGITPAAGSPYTPAVRAGNLLFISGQLGLDPETKKPHEDFVKQIEGCVRGIRLLVESAGGSLDNVIKTTVLMQDLAQFAQMNEVYGSLFTGEIRPARSTFQVAGLPLGAAIEIEAIAVLPDAS